MSEMGEAELREALVEALRRLQSTTSGHGCRFAYARQGRPRGETCRQFKSWQQGVECMGCDICEAREFLVRFGIDPWM